MAPVGLICFHHAGGGSTSFHALRRALTDVATLPGRESRRAEPRHVDADSCVHALADELEEKLTRPHVPLGHSMGALLAYSLSQQRISRGLRQPEAVSVASCRAPRQQARAENLQSMDDYRRDDPLAPPDTLAAWRLHSLQPYPVRLYHGGHSLFRSPDPALVTAIARVAAAATFQGSGIR